MENRTIFVFKGIVFNKNKEVLIDNRKEETLDDANGKWENPGGKIEFGETPEDAVEREIFEETGYKVKVNELIPYTKVSMWEYSKYKQHTVIFFYICELLNEEHSNMKDEKINEYKQVKIDEIDDYNFLSGNKEAIKVAIKNTYQNKCKSIEFVKD